MCPEWTQEDWLRGEDLNLRPLGYENNGGPSYLVLLQFVSVPISLSWLELETGPFFLSAFLFYLSLAGFVKKC